MEHSEATTAAQPDASQGARTGRREPVKGAKVATKHNPDAGAEIQAKLRAKSDAEIFRLLRRSHSLAKPSNARRRRASQTKDRNSRVWKAREIRLLGTQPDRVVAQM